MLIVKAFFMEARDFTMSIKCGLISDQDHTKVCHTLQLFAFTCDTVASQSLAFLTQSPVPRGWNTPDLITWELTENTCSAQRSGILNSSRRLRLLVTYNQLKISRTLSFCGGFVTHTLKSFSGGPAMELDDFGCDKKHIKQNNVYEIEGFLGRLSNPCYFAIVWKSTCFRGIWLFSGATLHYFNAFEVNSDFPWQRKKTNLPNLCYVFLIQKPLIIQ